MRQSVDQPGVPQVGFASRPAMLLSGRSTQSSAISSSVAGILQVVPWKSVDLPFDALSQALRERLVEEGLEEVVGLAQGLALDRPQPVIQIHVHAPDTPS